MAHDPTSDTRRPRLIRPRLSGVLVPPDAPYARDMPLPADRRDAKYIENYDTRTLIYDAVSDGTRISLFCPRLFNLWPLLRDGLRLNGAPVRVRRHRTLRFERLDLPKGAFGDLTVEIDGTVLPVSVHQEGNAAFAGLDVMIAMVKNTPAQWIVDWANYHHAAHGTQGLILLDNGSEPEMLEAAVAALEAETALQQIAVVSAPFPYGGNAGGRFVAPAKFLQVAMLNLMRARFFGKARGILSVDVDEFVQPMPAASAHRTVYDLARSKAVGCVTFAGEWAFAENAQGPTPQRDHSLTDPSKLVKNPKWCIVPRSLADRFVLAVHRPAGPLLPLTREKGIAYWHFRATTTGWKAPRFRTGAKGVRDAALLDALARYLP